METFILQQFVQDLSVCDGLIEYHKASKHKYEGTTSYGVDRNIKASTDVEIGLNNVNDDAVQAYLKQLKLVSDSYIEKYKFCNHYNPWNIVESFAIQHYKPNEGYFQWHTERSTNESPNNNRHLAFMTYLNDIDDGGETEFYYQELKIKPQKGLTIMWAADWTHTHRGITSPTQDKYIVTGWYNFMDKTNG